MKYWLILMWDKKHKLACFSVSIQNVIINLAKCSLHHAKIIYRLHRYAKRHMMTTNLQLEKYKVISTLTITSCMQWRMSELTGGGGHGAVEF